MDLDFDDLSIAAPAARAGARFKPKVRPQPKKKQVSLSTSQTTDLAKEKLSTQEASNSETIVPESGTIDQSTIRTLSEKNVDVVSGGVNLSMESSVFRACTNVVLEEKISDDSNDPITQDSPMFRDFDENAHAQTETMQTGEEECRVDMKTLDIVQEEGISSPYEKHTGKFQPKSRLLNTVIEETECQYSVEDTSYFSMGTNESEFTINEESRNSFNKSATNNGEFQEEELNIPHQVPREMAPEMEEQFVSPSTNNTVEEERPGRGRKKGKSKRGRKRKATSEEDPNKSNENPEEKKKFKHSSRRQRKRTLEKELLETPDDEIRFLPIRDMLRLVEYKEWLEKKEGKGAAAVVPPTQESNMNASENQDYSQGFDAEDDFGMEDGENQEANVVKPDSPVNYQTYMNKTPRTRWSKQDTELFYEGIQEFGSNLSMVQQLFPDRTRQQIKLKFKLEERRNPELINAALSSRSKHLTHFKTVIKKLQEEAAAEREGEEEEEEEGEGEDEAGAETETTTDVPENEQPAKSDETERAGDGGGAGVKESDGEDVNGVKSDGGNECDDDEGDDDDFWNSYKSDL